MSSHSSLSTNGKDSAADVQSTTTTTRHDEFLRSMTFASGGTNKILGGMSGCDDCGPFSDEVPPTIRNAVNEHLRKRKLEQQSRQLSLLFDGSKRLHIRQNRELVKREGGFSLWRLDIPLDGGDPIVEYRNNHRILFIKQLNKSSKVYSVGKGIIGSAAEEGTRKCVNWKEGSAYILPQAQGIACGWMQTLADEKLEDGAAADGSSKSSKQIADIEDVIIYSLKVSPDILTNWKVGDDDIPADVSPWVLKSHDMFHRCLSNYIPTNEINTTIDDCSSGGIELSNDESLLMSVIIELASGQNL